jgi:outer membrane lipopolysaccharide assembly protein LptE/RlpB
MRRVARLGVSGLLLLTGCGYSLVRTSGALGDVRSVAIETPANDSAEAGVEFLVADALRREFLQRGAVRLVENPTAADLVLGGRVLSLRARGQSLTSTTRVLEYEVTLALDLEATRRDGSDVPLGAHSLRETERYLASANAEALRKNREEALRRVAQVLAGRIYDALYVSLVP